MMTRRILEQSQIVVVVLIGVLAGVRVEEVGAVQRRGRSQIVRRHMDRSVLIRITILTERILPLEHFGLGVELEGSITEGEGYLSAQPLIGISPMAR